MGFGNNVEKCNFGDTGLADDDGGGAVCDSRDAKDGFGSVSCSICLEMVTKNGDRSWTKLQCGHLFHLDCIGSAFNAKGMMQCPNCRKIEKGQWLYANGCRPIPEFNVEDWAHEEDMYDLGYSEMSFGVQWCPFGSLARLPSFEDGEFSLSSYHDLLGQHGFFTEPGAASAGHPCPYVAYFGPIHPSSSSAAVGISDSSSFSSHWSSGSSMAGEVAIPYGFAVDPHYHGWDYHSPAPFSASGAPPMAARTSRASSDASRPMPPQYMRPPVHGHRAGSSVASVPPYPGSNARNRDRVQALQAYYQQPRPNDSSAVSRTPVFPSGRRSTRGVSSGMASTASSSDQTGGGGGGFVRFNIWEQDQFQQPQMERYPSRWVTEGSGSFQQRHGAGNL